jgi:cytochrome c-type biogenesis protein CcmF
VRGYTVTYLGPDIHRSAQKTTVEARVRLARAGDVLGVYAPAISTFPNFTSGIGTPSVRPGLLRDVYLTLVSSPTQTGRVGIRVQINPMVVWLWVGGLIMAIGTGLALVPNRRRRVIPEREPVSLTDAEPPELVEAST